MSVYLQLVRSVMLASFLVLGGCAGESPESVKLKEIAPTLHEKLVTADQEELQNFLEELGPENERPLGYQTPTGEGIDVNSNLVRTVVRQRLGQE